MQATWSTDVFACVQDVALPKEYLNISYLVSKFGIPIMLTLQGRYIHGYTSTWQ